MPSSEEETVPVESVEDEDPQKLVVSRKKLCTNLVAIGIALSLIIVSLLCSFLIPGLWQFGVMVFIAALIFIGMNLEEFGLSSPQTEEPKPLTGFELC